jgi:hypothetical protein
MLFSLEVPAMRRFRVQFKVRQVMFSVAIAALLLGVQATRRRWADYRREAAYHANCERFYALMADRRFAAVQVVHFRADETPKRYSLSSKLTRPGEWADSCRSYGAEHHRMKVYWESRW